MLPSYTCWKNDMQVSRVQVPNVRVSSPVVSSDFWSQMFNVSVFIVRHLVTFSFPVQLWFLGMDSFIIVKCEGESVKSEVRKHTTNPQYDLQCVFYRKRPKKEHIAIEVCIITNCYASKSVVRLRVRAFWIKGKTPPWLQLYSVVLQCSSVITNYIIYY